MSVATRTPAIALERARRVLRLEREAIAETESRLGDDFVAAVALIARSTGRVIVSGVGKSGLIGRKIAATLTSTGTPAMFLHPVEGVHGDLGIVGPGDVAILLSKSGATEEILGLLQHLKRLGAQTIAITGERDSPLGRHADATIDAWVREEACPHDLAPTTSTTVALALGDALAVALLEEKGFRREDFARLHPGGALGRRLLTKVSDVMLREELPVVPPDTAMRRVVVQLAERRGIAIACDPAGQLLGVLTSGDFTRLLEHRTDWLDIRLDEVMNRDPKVADAEELGSAVVFRMEQHGIMAMPVVSGGRLVGVVHLHDLMRAGAS